MCTIIEKPISTEMINSWVAESRNDHKTGAFALFLGKVRADSIDGRIVTGIEYSAYPEMAEKETAQIKSQLFNTFDQLSSVSIFHSTGLVKVGEISLFVQVGSHHRKQAFAAIELCVELIKDRLPFWKKELFSDGTHRWVDGPA